MRRVINQHEAELAAVRPESEPIFDDAAADLATPARARRRSQASTLADYRLMVAAPDSQRASEDGAPLDAS